MKPQPPKPQLFIGATVQPIQNCELLAICDDSTLFVHKRSLIIMDFVHQTLKSCLIEDEKILGAVYYAALEVFVIGTDRYLLVVNKEAEVISRQRIPELLQAKSLLILNMEDGYQGIPFQRKDHLLYFTNEYMFKAPILVKYERSLLKSKSLCAITFQFVEKPAIAHFEWSAHYVYLERVRLLVCWNQSETYVFQTPVKLGESVNMLYIYDKILRKNKLYESDNKINAFQASLKNRLLIAAFQLGSIKVYKLDETKKYVCQLRGHQRQCTGLYIPPASPDLLYSCGLDNSVRIWDLMDFGQVYHVRFDVICCRVEMLNQKLIFAKSVDNRRAFFVKFNIGLLRPVLSQTKSGRLVSLTSDGQWAISLYSNNFVEAFLLGDYNNEVREFNEKIEFPNKYGYLRTAVKLREETFAVCLEKGFSIMKLNKKQSQNENFQLKRLVYNHSLQAKPNQKGKLLQIIHQKLLGTYFFTILQDWKNIPIAINVTAVSFILATRVPKWDIDVHAKYSENAQDYVILGSDRGYIYFINIKSRTHYHTRVNFHSNTVANVERVRLRGCSDLCFISMSNTQEIAIWELSEKRTPALLIRITYTKDISVLKPVNQYLGIGCKSGQFVILQLGLESNRKQQDQVLQFHQSTLHKEEGHLKSIISIDFLRYKDKDVWLTGGDDYAVKLWRGVEKELIFEIRIFGMINCVIFAMRGLDLIMSHGENGQISVITERSIQQFRECKEGLEKDVRIGDEEMMMTQVDIRGFLCPSHQELSPGSPKKKQKDQTTKDARRSQIDQLLKLRSMQKTLQLQMLPIKQRRSLSKKEPVSKSHNTTPTKQLETSMTGSIVLPKINSKHVYLGTDPRRYKEEKNMKEEAFLDKLESSRMKSYSHVGRLNL